MKKSLAVMLALIMVLCMIPTTALAASNSTVVLHPSVNNTVTGVKVKVGDKIDGHSITKISGYDITVDLGKYNVNNGTFRLPYAKDIWEGVDNNKVDYISWAGSGSNRRSEGASALLANGKNTAYYYFKGAPTLKTFTLKYDANGGTGAPATQTYTASSQYENSHTFTISSNTPTREGYEFKGWAESPNDTAATRQPGGSIVVTGITTLYAVWEENNPTPPTPPTTDKPEPPKPENTPGIPGLTGENVVKVMCVTENSSHAEKSYQLIADSYDVGNVEGDATSGYTCTITVDPAKYVTEYNKTHGDHALDPNPQSRSITFEWKNNSWALAAGQNLPITFTVIHNTQEPPTDTPNLPADIIKELVGSGNIKVKCTTANTTHPIESYSLLDESYTTGTVTKDGDAYTCTITVDPAKYVTEYNKTHGDHALDPNPQSGSITFKWENDEWTLLAGQNLPITFTVVHDTQEPPTPGPSENPNPSPSTEPTPTPTPTPGGGNGGGHSHYHPYATPVPVIVIPPKTGDMTVWQSILHFLGIR